MCLPASFRLQAVYQQKLKEPMEDWDARLLSLIKELKEEQKKIFEAGVQNAFPDLKRMSQIFDDYYVLNKLKIYCQLLSYQKFASQKMLPCRATDLRLMPEVLALAKSNPGGNIGITVYYLISRLFESVEDPSVPDKELFAELEDLFGQSIGQFSVEEQVEVFSFFTNYCIWKVNHHPHDGLYGQKVVLYSGKVIDLKYNVRKRKRPHLPSSIYKNVVVTALQINDQQFFRDFQIEGMEAEDYDKGFQGKFEWVDNFIHTYRKVLSAQMAKLYYPYCRALVLFNAGRFEEAYHALGNPMRKRKIFINMNIKMLQLKILYELNLSNSALLGREEIDIETVAERFRKTIGFERKSRKQLSYHVGHYQQFEELFRKLLKLYEGYQLGLRTERDEQFKKTRNQLIEEVKNTNPASKSWFLEKLEAL